MLGAIVESCVLAKEKKAAYPAGVCKFFSSACASGERRS